ncbi:MAG: glycosyltransferase family 2 protein [Gemmatimonadales bacterium]
MGPASIGVAIVNWNRPTETIACLESLRAAVPGPARVVVVDNGSSDGSAETLHRWAAGLAENAPDILRSNTNRGFAAGINQAVSRLAGDRPLTHFLLLNNDATVDPGCFAECAAALGRAPDVGILGATIYEGARRERVWYAGGRLPRLRALATHDTTIPRDGAVVPTEFVTGCAMLVSRRAWETLGPLPECYFMYFEDAEYSLRARAAGFPVLYAPRAVIHHAVGAAVRDAVRRPDTEYQFTRARVLFVRRNARGWRRMVALGYVAVTRVARAVGAALTGRPALAGALLRGVVDGYWR